MSGNQNKTNKRQLQWLPRIEYTTIKTVLGGILLSTVVWRCLTNKTFNNSCFS